MQQVRGVRRQAPPQMYSSPVQYVNVQHKIVEYVDPPFGDFEQQVQYHNGRTRLPNQPRVQTPVNMRNAMYHNSPNFNQRMMPGNVIIEQRPSPMYQQQQMKQRQMRRIPAGQGQDFDDDYENNTENEPVYQQIEALKKPKLIKNPTPKPKSGKKLLKSTVTVEEASTSEPEEVEKPPKVIQKKAKADKVSLRQRMGMTQRVTPVIPTIGEPVVVSIPAPKVVDKIVDIIAASAKPRLDKNVSKKLSTVHAEPENEIPLVEKEAISEPELPSDDDKEVTVLQEPDIEQPLLDEPELNDKEPEGAKSTTKSKPKAKKVMKNILDTSSSIEKSVPKSILKKSDTLETQRSETSSHHLSTQSVADLASKVKSKNIQELKIGESILEEDRFDYDEPYGTNYDMHIDNEPNFDNGSDSDVNIVKKKSSKRVIDNIRESSGSDSQEVVKPKPKKQAKKPVKKRITEVIKVERTDKGIHRPEINDDGTRKSRRTKVEPLKYWLGETIVYNRRDSGVGGAGVMDVIRVDEEFEHKPHVKSSKSSKLSAKSKPEPILLKDLKQPEVPDESLVINFATKEEIFQSTLN